jgi:hypothetical protein
MTKLANEKKIYLQKLLIHLLFKDEFESQNSCVKQIL